MVSLGHEVTVFTSSVDSKSSFDVVDGIKIYRGATNFKVAKSHVSFNLFLKPLQHDFDIVHAHFCIPPGDVAGLFYARMKKKPFIVTYHADTGGEHGSIIRKIGLNLFNKLAVKQILSGADTIICNSTYYIDDSRFLPAYRDKVIPIPCGINKEEIEVPYTKEECREKLSLPPDSKIILFVGYLVYYKSPNLLIESLPSILREVPNARLVFVGDGPMRPDLEELAKKLDISDKVLFTGMVSNDLKVLYYKAADTFVLPSTMSGESFGIVLLEAAVAQLPIVVSSLNAFRCFVEDQYNGLVTRSGDINSIAEAIIRVLSKPDLRQKLIANASKRVEDFTWSKIARTTEKVYDEIVKDL
jgi:glycosyltransferase involved in cell wall biosynthesis